MSVLCPSLTKVVLFFFVHFPIGVILMQFYVMLRTVDCTVFDQVSSIHYCPNSMLLLCHQDLVQYRKMENIPNNYFIFFMSDLFFLVSACILNATNNFQWKRLLLLNEECTTTQLEWKLYKTFVSRKEYIKLLKRQVVHTVGYVISKKVLSSKTR